MLCQDKFLELYHKAPSGLAFCPYRVCPIGAHSDHNLGKITGFAIDKGIHIAFSPKQNGVVELCSLQFPKRAQWHILQTPSSKEGDWADYLRGVTLILGKRYPLIKGLSGVIEGSLPIGGLSSSAAVALAFLQALCSVNGLRLDPSEMIEISVLTENTYVGVNSGKLDQSCEVYSAKDRLLYLDTMDDSYELISFGSSSPGSSVLGMSTPGSSSLGMSSPCSSALGMSTPGSSSPGSFVNYSPTIAIFFSGVERSLAGSKFNMRVDEARSAAYALKAFSGMEYGKFGETNLRDVPREVYEQYKHQLPQTWRLRAEHWYTEFDRVQRGAEAWRRGDIEEYGRLSFESGHSSIYNWETGSPELKALYEIMTHTDGIYGGRFSGAGFKGCCMALIDPAYAESIEAQVAAEYLKQFPQLEGKYSFHLCRSADGVSMVSQE